MSEYQGHQIFQWFEEHMGSERAASMMSLLPPVGWGDIATGADLRNLEISLRGEIARLDGGIAKLDGGIAKVDGKVDKVHGDLMNEMAKLRQQMYAVVIGGNIALASLILGATGFG